MKLLAWLVICLGQILICRLNFLEPLIKVSDTFHLWCMQLLNRHPSSMNWLYAAVLFGEDRDLRSKPDIAAFFVLGIYHIIVVSGSHLVLLQKIFEKLLWFIKDGRRRGALLIFLGLFTMANQWQAACFRAYLTWIGNTFFKRHVSHQADLQILITLVCLCLNPTLVNSLSFHLSCAASLALSMVGSLNITSSRLQATLTPVFCVCLTAPLIFSLQPCLSWLVIPVNIFALPVVETILLPAGMICFVFPFLKPVVEPVLQILFKILDAIAQYHEPVFCLREERSRSWGMVYVFVVYLSWRLLLPLLLRAEFKKSQQQF